MKRKIDWNRIAVIYSFKPFLLDPHVTFGVGLLIGKLNTGEYFKMKGNFLPDDCDVDCGCIWTASELATLLAIDDDKACLY